MWDEEERRGSKRQLEQSLGRRKSSHYKKTRPQYHAKGKEIEVNYPREGAGRVPSKRDCCKIVGGVVGYAPGGFVVDINNTPGTWSDEEG